MAGAFIYKEQIMNPSKTTKPDPPPPVTSDADARAFEERIYAGGQPEKPKDPEVPETIPFYKRENPKIKTRKTRKVGVDILAGMAGIAAGILISKMLPPSKKKH